MYANPQFGRRWCGIWEMFFNLSIGYSSGKNYEPTAPFP